MAEKSSPTEEFLESWNEYMPEAHINEGELKKPTEILFRKWLFEILNKLDVDTSCYENMNVEIGSRLRCLRFKLISTVNYFLSIPSCQKKMDLNYCNLINPTFKIVFNTLRYLLNYSFFINMIYANNITECAKKVEERNQLRSEKNQLRKQIEEAKIEEENCVKSYKDYEKRIPQQKSTIAALHEKSERLKKEIQKIEQDIEKTDMILLELRSRQFAMSENIVSSQEAESICASKESVERQLAEQEDYILAERQKLKEISGNVERTRSFTNAMEILLSKFSFDTSELKVMKKKIVDMESTLNATKDNITKLNANIELLNQTIKLKTENTLKANRKKDEIEATIGSRVKATLQVLKEQVSTLHKIAIKEDELLIAKQRVKDELDLIFKLSTNVVKIMSSSSFENWPTE